MRQQCGTHADSDQKTLVRYALDGDESAFEELIQRCYQRCLRLAASILHDSGEAEDVVQNACWKAHRRLRQFRGESQFSTWLAEIVINQAIHQLKRSRRSRGLLERDSLRGFPNGEPDPETTLGGVQVRTVLRQEIGRIPPRFRTVLILKDLEELPLAEVAARLDVTVQAVKSRLLRARQELRSRMVKHCGISGHQTLLHQTRRL